MTAPSSAALAFSVFYQLDVVSVVAWNPDTFVISIEIMDDPISHQFVNWPNYCVDVAGESTENGTPVWLWECAGIKGQEWVFDNGQLKSALSTGKCLDAGDMELGSQLQILDCADV